MADRLSREFKVSAVYSSDLKRAFETAEKIAATCGIAEVYYWRDETMVLSFGFDLYIIFG